MNIDRATDWALGLTIFLVVLAALSAPLWLCFLKASCEVV